MALAVLDIGKTHAKLSLVDGEGAIRRSLSRANEPREISGRGVLDTEGIALWLVAGLKTLKAIEPIEAIVPVAHGAAAAYVGKGELAAPVLDYETAIPPDVLARYRALRDPFSRTLSPALPRGLNLGLQLFWQEQSNPALRDDSVRILPWPQYWAFMLSGVAASEVTSLGCHTDLWFPEERDFSNLAKREGWDRRFAPLRKAGDVLSPIKPELAAETGLSPRCQILCGLHDSNAALWGARAAKGIGDAFSLVSTGTWFVIFQVGGRRPVLDPERDTLGNVGVDGEPVPSARFMGGREYEAIVGDAMGARPGTEDVERLVARGVASRPSFVAGSGPFPDARGEILGRIDTREERAALASLHLAHMTHASLRLLNAAGPILIEGRFAGDPVFAAAVAALAPGRTVMTSANPDGVVLGASRLYAPSAGTDWQPVAPLPVPIPAQECWSV